MLQATALRTAQPDRFQAPIVVTGSAYAQTVVDQLGLIRYANSIFERDMRTTTGIS